LLSFERRKRQAQDFPDGRHVISGKLPQKIETLQELAKFHKLNYPLTNWGVRDFGNSAYSSLEGPTGLVVIDRQGKIRLVRAIPRADDARDVERLLAELLAAPGGEE
jgi:peroxiredoxin